MVVLVIESSQNRTLLHPTTPAPPRLCLKKVSFVADGKQMWTEPCMVKVQSQSPTSTPGQEYIFIKENKGVHLHPLQHIKSHSSVCLHTKESKGVNDNGVCGPLGCD